MLKQIKAVKSMRVCNKLHAGLNRDEHITCLGYEHHTNDNV